MADFHFRCVKILGNPTRITSVFSLRKQKSALSKFCDLKRIEFCADFGAEDAARLAPCKEDKPKYAEIMPFQAGSDYSLSASHTGVEPLLLVFTV